MTRSRLVLALIAVIVGSTVFGGVAAAVGTAKADKLAACTSHKHVRVLGKKVKCHAGEKRLAWRVNRQRTHRFCDRTHDEQSECRRGDHRRGLLPV